MNCICGYDTDTQFIKFPNHADKDGIALPFISIGKAIYTRNEQLIDLMICPICGTVKVDLLQISMQN